MELSGRRLGRFSLNARRLFVAAALAPCLLSVANYYLNWELAGRFDRVAIAASFAALFLVMRYLGPTVDDIKRYRETEGLRD